MKWPWIIIGLIILALAIAICCGVPALDWIAWFFDFIKSIFEALANACRWLQKLVNWGVIHK